MVDSIATERKTGGFRTHPPSLFPLSLTRHTHTRTHIHTCTLAHTHTNTRTHTHTHPHARTRAHTHARTHTPTYARARTHTHTHTHLCLVILIVFQTIALYTQKRLARLKQRHKNSNNRRTVGKLAIQYCQGSNACFCDYSEIDPRAS